MFYLMIFWKTIFANPLKGLAFVFLSVAFIGSAFMSGKFEKKVLEGMAEMEKGASFFALIDARENNQRLARKLRILPGVEQVNILTENEISATLDDLLKSLDVGISKEFLNVSFGGMKVEFQKGLSARSQGLIRNYLSRLVGPDKLTMGDVTGESKEMIQKRGSFSSFIRSYFGPILTFILGLCWLTFFLFLRPGFLRATYLAEQYQRKEKIGFKSLVSGFAFLFLISFSTFFSFLGKPEPAQIIFCVTIMFMVSAAHIRGITWES